LGEGGINMKKGVNAKEMVRRWKKEEIEVKSVK
jgi:hypothetical protein